MDKRLDDIESVQGAGGKFLDYLGGGKDENGEGAGLGGSPGSSLGKVIQDGLGLPINPLDPAGNLLFGNDENPGLLGTGKFRPDVYGIDDSASQIQDYSRTRDYLLAQAGKVAGRTGPQLGSAATYGGANIDQSQSDAMRGRQVGLADMLHAQSLGQGPSLAQHQLGQATDRNLAQTMASAGSMRGLGLGGQSRALAAQRASISQQAAADSAMLRAQEQLAAQNQLGAMLAGTRGQDIGLATGQAQLQQQAGLTNAAAQNQFGMANMQSQLQQQQMNDQLVQFFTQSGLTIDQAQQAARMRMEELKVQQNIGIEGMKAGAYQGQREGMTGLMNMAGSALAMFSDERLKTDVKPASEKTYAFLDALSSHEYRYKDADLDDGENVSVMAQELEKSELGRRFVQDTPRGKQVRYDKGLAAMLAAQADLHKRIKTLESNS